MATHEVILRMSIDAENHVEAVEKAAARMGFSDGTWVFDVECPDGETVTVEWPIEDERADGCPHDGDPATCGDSCRHYDHGSGLRCGNCDGWEG
jgi:hypothetical protein